MFYGLFYCLIKFISFFPHLFGFYTFISDACFTIFLFIYLIIYSFFQLTPLHFWNLIIRIFSIRLYFLLCPSTPTTQVQMMSNRSLSRSANPHWGSKMFNFVFTMFSILSTFDTFWDFGFLSNKVEVLRKGWNDVSTHAIAKLRRERVRNGCWAMNYSPGASVIRVRMVDAPEK